MKETDKLVKTFSILLGIFLIIVICSCILGVIRAIVGFIPSTLPNDDKENVYVTYDHIKEIKVDLKSTNLNILRGSSFKIEKEDIKKDTIKIDTKGNSLIIREKNTSLFNTEDKLLTIYIPEDLELRFLEIDLGAGKLDMDNITAREFELDEGAGTINITNSKFDKTSISGGAGKMEIKNSTLKDLELETGVGSTYISGSILGKSEIECGVGSINLDLDNSQDDYTLLVEKGLGSIKINGDDVSSGTKGHGTNSLSIEGGVGSINIDFKNKSLGM